MKCKVANPSSSSCEPFVFSSENEAKIPEILSRYPPSRQVSAVLPLFELAQRQCGGWLPPSAIETVTAMLGMSLVRGYEVATFYTLFNLKPIGKYHIQVCGTPPCMLRGSEELLTTCKRSLGIDCGETTKDGQFTLNEVECLSACVNAPVIQINETYYENLTEESLQDLLEELAAC
jgi:NADH-quinone oxidoreductase subunit E